MIHVRPPELHIIRISLYNTFAPLRNFCMSCPGNIFLL
ncbi:hypothetical protein LOK49_LG10G00970 [Camellia lanceoleosa]|uniref:Uncharacterized protein n=1 Tax=Camellia lanceoleosa TaxID=1840588 RepID=A0ACC0GD93_9ERIC|nr:hypothetical protein LOK49_LG10G00970 [Camellia lanceoleosa]